MTLHLTLRIITSPLSLITLSVWSYDRRRTREITHKWEPNAKMLDISETQRRCGSTSFVTKTWRCYKRNVWYWNKTFKRALILPAATDFHRWLNQNYLFNRFEVTVKYLRYKSFSLKRINRESRVNNSNFMASRFINGHVRT